MRLNRTGFGLLIVTLWLGTSIVRAENFTGDARAVAKAEASRDTLSRYWFGEPMRRWASPCPITVRKADAASGSTSFDFHDGHVTGWRMNVAGTTFAETLATAIPHEVNHTVFASRFRRPLPRWLDEGAAMFVEVESEHLRSREGLKQNIGSSNFTPFRELFKNSGTYPRDGRRLANIYSEGFAIVEFLINHNGGRAKFVEFVDDVAIDADGSSTVAALRKHYGFKSADDLERIWYLQWQGRGGLKCSHHVCKAPHGAIFDPTLAIVDDRGNGIGFRSPVVGFVSPSGKTGCRLLVFGGRTCIPCQRWKATELPKVQAAGVPVEFIENRAEFRRWRVDAVPAFVVIHNGKETRRAVGFQEAADVLRLFGHCRTVPAPTAPTLATAPAPPELACRCEEIEAGVVELRELIAELQAAGKNRDERINAIADGVLVLARQSDEAAGRLSAVEGMALPIRIETSEGKVVASKRLTLTRDKNGRWVFSPIVLKFDENILRGSGSPGSK